MRIETFTMGFNIHGYNEARHAKTARYLKVIIMKLSEKDVLETVETLAQVWDEPFVMLPKFLHFCYALY